MSQNLWTAISIFYSFLQISSPRGCYHEPFGDIRPGNLDAYSRVRNKCLWGLILLTTHNILICGSVACILFSLFYSLHFIHAILCMPWCSKMSTPTSSAFINQFVFTVEVWLASLSSLDMYVLCSHFFPLHTMLPWTSWMLRQWIWKCFLEVWSEWMNVHTVSFIRCD